MKRIIYPVLGAEMAKRGIKQKAIGDLICVTESAISHKLHNDRKFTVDEAIKIQETLFPEIPVNELFKREKEVQL